MLIDFLAWGMVGVGLLVIGGQVFSLRQDRNRPAGRHSRDRERVKPEDLAKEWQRFRWTAFTLVIVPLVVLTEAGIASDPLRLSLKVLAIAATIILLIWEIRSWRGITERMDRLRALNSARIYFAPAVVQLLWLLNIWRHGMAGDVVIAALALVLLGPEVEPWIRRRLINRAGGTTAT